MSGNCLDIGTIQAFLDGETRPEEAVRISDHVASCDTCTIMLAQAEEESSMVFSVLDRELNTLVPTQRLWNRINAGITEEKGHTSAWQRFLGILTASLFNPSFAGAAGILLVLGMLISVWTLRSGSELQSDSTAGNNPPVGRPEQIASSNEVALPSAQVPVAVNEKEESRKENRVVETRLPESEIRRIINANYIERGPKKVAAVPASAQYLPGEESYIKAINELQQSVTLQNVSVKASSQVAYQRDLAVVDDSIQKMRQVVKKNPRNQAARQILYSSYQDKIDLLKSSAQRDELMASFQ